MTRKDYELIARVLGESFAAADSRNGLQAQLVNRMSEALAKDNPGFKPDRFAARVAGVEQENRS